MGMLEAASGKPSQLVLFLVPGFIRIAPLKRGLPDGRPMVHRFIGSFIESTALSQDSASRQVAPPASCLGIRRNGGSRN